MAEELGLDLNSGSGEDGVQGWSTLPPADNLVPYYFSKDGATQPAQWDLDGSEVAAAVQANWLDDPTRMTPHVTRRHLRFLGVPALQALQEQGLIDMGNYPNIYDTGRLPHNNYDEVEIEPVPDPEVIAGLQELLDQLGLGDR